MTELEKAIAAQAWEDSARKRLERSVAAAVARLRATADQIERETRQGIADVQARNTNYGRVAGQAVHTITWGVANTNLSNLIDAATDADAARAQS